MVTLGGRIGREGAPGGKGKNRPGRGASHRMKASSFVTDWIWGLTGRSSSRFQGSRPR